MAIERGQVYECEKCGKMVVVVRGGGPHPHCCGQQMTPLKENTKDAAVEKHVPVVESVDGGFRVKVGEVAHPMTDDHWIEWIELLGEKSSSIRFLDPGEEPEVVFESSAPTATARAFCNLHGLWKG